MGLPRRCALLLSCLLLVVQAAAPAGASEAPRYQGRLLVDVLQEMRERGMNLIFSSAVVGDDFRITIEPSTTDPRRVLDEILAPLGLMAEDGPADSVLILPRREDTGRLTGRVLSAARGTAIARATVRLADTSYTTASGPDGSFELRRIPVGTYQVLVEALGFRTAAVDRVRITSRPGTELAISLEPQPMFVTEVVVTPGRHSLIRREQAASHLIANQHAVLAPTIGGDISRVIELIPGVVAPDHSAAFNVRGSVTSDVSIVLDGLELYDAFHLRGFHSPFSLIDSNVVDRIEFFGGGFTADLGDRHGGFVEISSFVPGNAPKGEVELGLLNSRFSFRSPMRNAPGSWLVSARTWYPEALLDTIELGGGEHLDPRFADVYAKATFLPSSRHVLSAHGLLAYDRLTFSETSERINERIDALSRNGNLWLQALSAWSDEVTTETIVSGGRIERIRNGVSALEDLAVNVDDLRDINFFGLKHDLAWRASPDHILKGGLDLRRLAATYRYSNDSGLRDAFGSDPAGASFALDPEGTSMGLYVAHRVRLSSKLATEVGFRWDRQTYTGDNQLSPRFNAIWRPAERSEVRLALGRFQQSQRIHELNVQDGETRFHPAEASEQAEVSFQHRFPGGLNLRADAYYRRLSELRPRYENIFEPIELFPETIIDRVRIDPSRATLRGVELSLRGGIDHPLFWWVSYALSSAEDVVGGRKVPRSWDQTHAGKFLVGYRRGEAWTVSVNGSWRTGWPTTPATGRVETFPDGSTEIVPVPGARNSTRFPDYARFDLKARRSFELPRGRLWLTLEVLNVTDRDNACCVDEFSFKQRPDGSIDAEPLFDNWLGITPLFSVLWEF